MTEPGRGQDNLSERLDFMGLDEEARAALKKLQPLIGRTIGPALAAFYERARAHPSAGKALGDERLPAVKRLQERHWATIAAAEFGQGYASGVREIGEANGRIGLEPRWVIGGYALVVEQLIAAVIEERWPTFLRMSRARPGDVARAVSSLMKAALLDVDLSLSVYLETLNELRRRAEETGKEAIRKERELVAKSLGVALAQLAAKDLTSRMSGDIPEAYRELQGDFNAAIEQLESAMQGVNDAAETIHVGAQEIGAAIDDLSGRTERQAASLEETAAALGQITAVVNKSAESASRAREVVVAADHDAKASALIVRQTVESMDAIAKSAQQISQIIGAIDEIAFQTNLLALNAGVEAARAGAAGKGFAVVASEVRALAQRSAEAAKDIKRLISASTAQVENCVRLVAETGASLERITSQVAEINGAVAAIAAGAKEQAAGLRQVNVAIAAMDRATQENAAMAEQSAEASRALSRETDRLGDMIGEFSVEANGVHDLRESAPKPAPRGFAQPAKAAAPAKAALRKPLKAAAGR